jgi:hypothetical protein
MMAVYVNTNLMIADSMNELHRVAMEMGLDRTTYKHRNVPRYPITATQRNAAITHGASQLSNKDFLGKIRELKQRYQS